MSYYCIVSAAHFLSKPYLQVIKLIIIFQLRMFGMEASSVQPYTPATLVTDSPTPLLQVEKQELRLLLLVGLELLGLAPDELPGALPHSQLKRLALVVNVDVVHCIGTRGT